MSSLIDYKLLQSPTRGLVPMAKRNNELNHAITNSCTIPHRSLNITTKGECFIDNCELYLPFVICSILDLESLEDVWSNPLPYLRAVPDFDQDAPVYEWTESFSQAELKQRILGVGNIISMTPQTTTPYGSLITIKVLGDAGVKTLKSTDVTAALDLKSTRFTVSAKKTGAKQIPTSFQITGKGFGHAVGMSQWGAYNLARNGYSYHQILLYYYQGTTLTRIDVR